MRDSTLHSAVTNTHVHAKSRHTFLSKAKAADVTGAHAALEMDDIRFDRAADLLRRMQHDASSTARPEAQPVPAPTAPTARPPAKVPTWSTSLPPKERVKAERAARVPQNIAQSAAPVSSIAASGPLALSGAPMQAAPPIMSQILASMQDAPSAVTHSSVPVARVETVAKPAVKSVPKHASVAAPPTTTTAKGSSFPAAFALLVNFVQFS